MYSLYAIFFMSKVNSLKAQGTQPKYTRHILEKNI
jgi:hypothetical protein